VASRRALRNRHHSLLEKSLRREERSFPPRPRAVTMGWVGSFGFPSPAALAPTCGVPAASPRRAPLATQVALRLQSHPSSRYRHDRASGEARSASSRMSRRPCGCPTESQHGRRAKRCHQANRVIGSLGSAGSDHLHANGEDSLAHNALLERLVVALRWNEGTADDVCDVVRGPAAGVRKTRRRASIQMSFEVFQRPFERPLLTSTRFRATPRLCIVLISGCMNP
jgi:hypothetical protein